MLGFLLWFSLSAGLQDGYTILNHQRYDLPPISIAIELHAESDTLDIYAIYKNEMRRNDEVVWEFWPQHDTYTVGAKVTVGVVSVNIEHRCSHPVLPYGINKKLLYDTYMNKVEVKITSKDN